MDDRWLSVDEIADYLGVAKDTIYTWVTSIFGQDPLLQARQPIKQAKPTPPEDLPSGLDDDLPDFSGEQEGDQ